MSVMLTSIYLSIKFVVLNGCKFVVSFKHGFGFPPLVMFFFSFSIYFTSKRQVDWESGPLKGPLPA